MMCGSPCLPPILGTGLSSENHTSFSLTGILRHQLRGCSCHAVHTSTRESSGRYPGNHLPALLQPLLVATSHGTVSSSRSSVFELDRADPFPLRLCKARRATRGSRCGFRVGNSVLGNAATSFEGRPLRSLSALQISIGHDEQRLSQATSRADLADKNAAFQVRKGLWMGGRVPTPIWRRTSARCPINTIACGNETDPDALCAVLESSKRSGR